MSDATKYKWVGTRSIRPDGIDKVTGKANFGADRSVPGMLYGVIVRSPHAHARIRSIDTSGSIMLIMMTVLTVALLTYAVRGIYWGTLESCGISAHSKGLAIGVISLIGYSPEIWVPLLNGYLIDIYPGRTGYYLFYGSIGVLGMFGALAGFRLLVLRRLVSEAAA